MLFGIKTGVDGQQPFSGEVVGTDDWFSTTNSGTTYRLTQSQPNEAILVADVMCWGYVFEQIHGSIHVHNLNSCHILLSE